MHSRDKSNSQPFKDADSTFCGSSFVVGQHVVCINEKFGRDPYAKRKWERLGVRFPVKNVVYTIRGVFMRPNGRVGIFVDEIRNPIVPTKNGPVEAYFLASRFRPLQKLKLEDFMPIVEHLTDEVRA